MLHFGYPKTDPYSTAYIWIGSFFLIIIKTELNRTEHDFYFESVDFFCLKTDPNRTENTPTVGVES